MPRGEKKQIKIKIPRRGARKVDRSPQCTVAPEWGPAVPVQFAYPLERGSHPGSRATQKVTLCYGAMTRRKKTGTQLCSPSIILLIIQSLPFEKYGECTAPDPVEVVKWHFLKNVNQIFIIELTDIYRIVVFDD